MQSPQACGAASSDSSYNPIGDGTIERRCSPMARQPARGSTPATATQDRTLAVMQVCGGSQSFNVVNALRLLGRWTERTACSHTNACLTEGRHRGSRIGHTIGNRHDDDACKFDRPHRLPTKSSAILAARIVRACAA
ncbi:Arsenic resistance protein ArsH [Lysobacter capsici AZ78]|uniref:Arsenic resistance protein ArsH n=1 Tax=Lysobacter capsici AZ78 TaxID=1444315 RepID=A0A108U4V3_9GAMM|nr:Arsenic resistance protein ArsH [Lysobacter capsici AZ78]